MTGWRNAALGKPDADVIVIVHSPGSCEPVWLGYWDDDAECWYDVDGSRCEVSHWRELPEAPSHMPPGREVRR